MIGLGNLYQLTKEDEKQMALTLKNQEVPLFKVQQALALYQFWLDKISNYFKNAKNENKEKKDKEQKATTSEPSKQIESEIQDFYQCDELREQLELLGQVFFVCEHSTQDLSQNNPNAQAVSELSKAIRGNMVTLMQTYMPELKALRGDQTQQQQPR